MNNKRLMASDDQNLYISYYRCLDCINNFVPHSKFPTNINICISCGKSRPIWDRIKYYLCKKRKYLSINDDDSFYA